MPYVYVDEIPEGAEEADVVERDLLDSVADERDAALSKAESLAAELDDTKRKFAEAVLDGATIKRKQEEDVELEREPMTFENLFRGRVRHAD